MNTNEVEMRKKKRSWRSFFIERIFNVMSNEITVLMF